MLLASVWDEESADFIEELEVPAFKLPSADLTNLPLLEHIARWKSLSFNRNSQNQIFNWSN